MTATSKGLLLAAVILGGLAPFAGSPYLQQHGRIDVDRLSAAVAHEEDHVDAIDLAAWIKDRKPGLRVIDVRPAGEFDEFHIPTAENIPLEGVAHALFQPADTIVLYSGGGAHAAQAWVFLKALGHDRVFFLSGGLDEWIDDVLHPMLAVDATPAEKEAYERAAPISRYFGGEPASGVSRAEIAARGTSGHDPPAGKLDLHAKITQLQEARMLTMAGAATATDAFFADLRSREFHRLDESGEAYLDYTGSALYAASQVEAQASLLSRGVFGNPHSEHAPSQASTRVINAARAATLRCFGVTESTHAVCFTANTSAAIKLVGESYHFGPRTALVLAADNHNSVNGLREFAARAESKTTTLPLDDELRLHDPIAIFANVASRSDDGLIAFPAQSNFSGVRHPLALVAAAQALGFDVLLDAAAFVPTSRLDLHDCPADFVAVSFYKMFGLPTGVGALVVTHEALARLRRPWFAGGTVDYVSVQHQRHQLRNGHEGFEDGTPNFLGVATLDAGFALRDTIEMTRLASHIAALTRMFLKGLRDLTHADGSPLVEIYGPDDDRDRGGTVAFNVLDRDGRTVPYSDVEARARAAGVSLRGGCFCNPGAAEAAFGFDPDWTARCLQTLGRDFSIPRFAACLGPGATVGAVRASFGAPTNARDRDRALEMIASFAIP